MIKTILSCAGLATLLWGCSRDIVTLESAEMPTGDAPHLTATAAQEHTEGSTATSPKGEAEEPAVPGTDGEATGSATQERGAEDSDGSAPATNAGGGGSEETAPAAAAEVAHPPQEKAAQPSKPAPAAKPPPTKKKPRKPEPAKVAAATSSSSVDGAALWSSKCAKCHGKSGAGDTKVGEKMGIAAMDAAWKKEWSDGAIKKAISKGVKREKDGKKQSMKGFAGKLSDAEIDALVRHVRKL